MWLSRLGVLGWGVVLAVSLAGAGRVSAADQWSDYDRSAARALYNTVKSNSVADKQAANPGLLDEPPTKDGKAIRYTIRVAGEGTSTMMSGYYRILVNGRMTDPTSAGWKVMGEDQRSGVQLLKQTKELVSGPCVDYVARKKVGNIVLTVMQRRKVGESEQDATAAMVARYEVLYRNAKENQLFSRVDLKVIGGEPRREPGDATARPAPLQTSRAGGMVIINYSAAVLDADDRPVPGVKRLHVRLEGPLARFAALECKRGRPGGSAGAWIIEDPRAGEEFTLVVRAGEREFRDALYQFYARSKSTVQPIRIKVTADFGPMNPA